MESCVANWPLILEYLKVLLAWPLLTMVVLTVALFSFRAEIRSLINRIRAFEGFGAKVDASPLADAQGTQSAVAPPLGKTPLDEVSSDPAKASAEILKWWSIAKFEGVLNRIFGTQFRMLQVLAHSPTTGETVANLTPFHAEHLQLAGAIAVPFGSFFAFLTSNMLIRLDGAEGPEQRVFVTQLGADFLKHVIATYEAAPFRPW